MGRAGRGGRGAGGGKEELQTAVKKGEGRRGGRRSRRAAAGSVCESAVRAILGYPRSKALSSRVLPYSRIDDLLDLSCSSPKPQTPLQGSPATTGPSDSPRRILRPLPQFTANRPEHADASCPPGGYGAMQLQFGAGGRSDEDVGRKKEGCSPWRRGGLGGERASSWLLLSPRLAHGFCYSVVTVLVLKRLVSCSLFLQLHPCSS